MLSFNSQNEFLEDAFQQFNNKAFIESDPISVPHLFSKKEDIEISGFLTSVISWGQRKSIIKSAKSMFEMMDNSPYDFIKNHDKKDLKAFERMVYRTFQGVDCVYFIRALKNIYNNHKGLESVVCKSLQNNENDMQRALGAFRTIFFELPHPQRSEKHFANAMENASAKRLNMFLRWMVRKDRSGVDFGIWKSISPALLYIPLDVHSGNVARETGLLLRKQNDWKAVSELTNTLRKFDASDPVKYDFALFGAGVNAKI